MIKFFLSPPVTQLGQLISNISAIIIAFNNHRTIFSYGNIPTDIPNLRHSCSCLLQHFKNLIPHRDLEPLKIHTCFRVIYINMIAVITAICKHFSSFHVYQCKNRIR